MFIFASGFRTFLKKGTRKFANYTPCSLNTGKYLIFVRTGLPSVLRTAGQEWWMIPELP